MRPAKTPGSIQKFDDVGLWGSSKIDGLSLFGVVDVVRCVEEVIRNFGVVVVRLDVLEDVAVGILGAAVVNRRVEVPVVVDGTKCTVYSFVGAIFSAVASGVDVVD